MTEDEARTKWCPMVRAKSNVIPVLTYAEPDASKARNPEQARCIGRECMMWREAINGAGMGVSSFYCGVAGRP